MSKRLIADIDDELLQRLQRQAKEHGLSVEEEHLRILASALKYDPMRGETASRPSFIEFLRNEGVPWPDDFIPLRSKDVEANRQVQFS